MNLTFLINTTKSFAAIRLWDCADKLQHIQHLAPRIITGEPTFCPITPILQRLSWIPIPDIIYLREAAMTYKCINSLVPEYLFSKLESCKIKNSAYNTRSQHELRPLIMSY